MREINLTKGKVTLVDDEGFEWLSQYHWYAHFDGKNWYAARYLPRNNGKHQTSLMHREIMDAPKGMTVDHKDGNGLNNQKCNLRICLNSQNVMNRKRTSNRVVSQFKGISWNKRHKKWRARIGIGGKVKYLGCYESEEEAARAYGAAAKIYHGEYARPNFMEQICA